MISSENKYFGYQQSYKVILTSFCLAWLSGGCVKSADIPQPREVTTDSSSGSSAVISQGKASQESFYSAVRPCIPKTDDTYLQVDLQTLLTETEDVFKTKQLTEILSRSENGQPLPSFSLPAHPDIAVFYRSSSADTGVPVVVAGFGYGVNVIDASGIFWYEDGKWKAQPYPQVAPELAQQRSRALEQSPFCAGLVVEVHQQGNLLAVVNDLGSRGTSVAQEVQLLERNNGIWKVIWAPTYERWQTLQNTRIEFQGGINSFVAYHEDPSNPKRQWQEVWQLRGRQYAKKDAVSSP